MTQIVKLNRKMATYIISLVVILLVVGCSSESPSRYTEKWLNAVVKKDKETVAKYLCFPALSPEEELLQIVKAAEDLTNEGLWGFEIKDELISADGKSAIVTVIVKFDSDLLNDSGVEELTLFWVKTKTDGWKIDVDKCL
jgi:hypothetical protein